jgi:hypothetical protein
LRTNAALDREELDLLWWMLGERSGILGKPLESLSIPSRAIITGLELGALMRRVPSQSHRNLVMRNVGVSEPMSLPELLVSVGDERTSISETLSKCALLADAPSVFPLLAALRSGGAVGDAAAQRRSLADWAFRALLERAVVHIHDSGSKLK